MRRLKLVALASTVLAGGTLGVPFLADAQTAPAAALPGTQAASLQEVVVTARRHAEDIQRTPVSIAAVSGQAIERAGVTNVANMTSLVPGVNFSGSGSPVNTAFSIRGMSRGVVGDAAPAVATYIDEVPTSTWAAGLPTYDVSDVQVLKGPQGTLFGKNTTTGAVLVNTREPSYQYGAWLSYTYGSYNWNQFQGAANLPLIADKAALRVAADIDRRDGYTKNMSMPGQDFDDVHDNNFRVSLRLDPTENLKNLTVYDSTESNTHGAGVVFYQYQPGGALDNPALVWINGGLLSFSPLTPCNGMPVCDVRAAAARQAEAGPRRAWNDLPPIANVRTRSIINNTTWDVGGGVTLKNIFGYRTVYAKLFSNIDGYEAPLINSESLVDIKQFSDELQASGKSFNDSLSWIGGFFWLKAEPSGPNRLTIQQLAAPGVPFNFPAAGLPFGGGVGNADFYTDESKALYGQVSYDFSQIAPVVKGLSADLGLRYTWDTNDVCSITGQLEANQPPPPSACLPANSASAESSKLTYTVGLNYQATPDVLTYIVTRRGYRGGGVNPPKLGGTLVPFQTYAPELVNDVELGLKTNWRIMDRPGRFNVAAYASRFKHLQASITTGAANQLTGGPDGDFNPANDPSNTTFYANVGSARVRGVEGDFAFEPIDGLELTANGTIIDKTITSVGVNLPATLNTTYTEEELASFAFLGSPKFSYNLGMSYTSALAGDRGEIVLSAKYFKISSIQYGSVMAPGYERIDLRADWNRVMGSDFDASVFINNATDRVSIRGPALSSVGLGANSVNYNEPLMAGVRLRYAFGGER